MHSPAKWRCCEVCDVVSAFHFNYSMKARLRYSIGLFSMLCMGWSWNSTHFVSLCIQTINSPTTTEHRTTEKNSRKWIDGWFLILQPCKIIRINSENIAIFYFNSPIRTHLHTHTKQRKKNHYFSKWSDTFKWFNLTYFFFYFFLSGMFLIFYFLQFYAVLFMRRSYSPSYSRIMLS